MSEQSVIPIAAAIVRRPDGRVLLLKRSPTHSTNAGQWCFVTGYIEDDETPRQAAIRELSEELGVDAQPVDAGDIVVVETERGTLHVHPFRFDVEDFPVALDWEHTDYAWIEPEGIYDYNHVPQLDEDLIALGLLDAK